MIQKQLAVMLILSSIGIGYASQTFAACRESLATRGVAIPNVATPSPLKVYPDIGVFFSHVELTLWRKRRASGPFLHNDDFTYGSPGDWDRIKARADAFVASPETPAHAAVPTANLMRAAFGARDAAFSYLLTLDQRYLTAVRLWLLRETTDVNSDVASLCYRLADGSTVDGYSQQAMWVARVALTYDFVKAGLSDQDRVTIERWLRRSAYFMADHVQWGLVFVFPNRRSNDYATRTSTAALDPSAPAAWVKASVDTNGDCAFSGLDSPTAYDVYAYVNADGTRGPRLSVLSQWWNNRKSDEVLAFGIIGAMLQDAFLISEAKRYITEWLAYSVWPDGIQGEYVRNGNYCVAQQGVMYGTHNTQAAMLVADALARKGDRTLYTYETRQGLFGSQSIGNQPGKSIRLAVGAHVGLVDGSLRRYYYEPQRGAAQTPRAATQLNSIIARTNNSLYHDLSYLPGNRYFDNAWVNSVILRIPGAGAPAFPGSDSMRPDGGPEPWSGATGLFPGSLFMFAQDPGQPTDRIWAYGLPLLP